MARLKAATLIETLTAFVIISIIISAAYLFLDHSNRSHRRVLNFRAEKEIERMLIDLREEDKIGEGGLLFRVWEDDMGQGFYRRQIQVLDDGRILMTRRKWIQRNQEE